MSDSVAMATRLINAKGAIFVWIKSNAAATNATVDPNQPWKRTEIITNNATVPPVRFTVKGLLKRTGTPFANQVVAMMQGTEVPGGKELVILPGGLPFTPEITDTVQMPDGTVKGISGVDVLRPAGVPVLWYVTLEN